MIDADCVQSVSMLNACLGMWPCMRLARWYQNLPPPGVQMPFLNGPYIMGEQFARGKWPNMEKIKSGKRTKQMSIPQFWCDVGLEKWICIPAPKVFRILAKILILGKQS